MNCSVSVEVVSGGGASRRSPRARSLGCALGACAWFLVLVAAEPAAAETPAAEPTLASDDVQARFATAVRLYKEDQIAQALPLFEQLAKETQSPNASLYVGHCLVKLARYVDAYRAFQRTVTLTVEQDEEKYEPTREAARSQLAALDLRVAKLIIAMAEVPPDVRVSIDGEALDPATIGSATVLEPGDHVVEGAAPDTDSVRRKFSIQAGHSKTLALTLTKRTQSEATRNTPHSPPAPPSDQAAMLRTAGFAATAVGAAGFVVFSIAGLKAKSVHDDLEAACGDEPCSDPGHRDDAARGKTYQSVANVGLVVGALGTLTGGTLLLFGYGPAAERGPAVGLFPGGGTLTYTGAF